jgi:hypothetical protein
MANQEQLAILEQGVEVWNEWRDEHPDIREPDLSKANLNNFNLNRANLSNARLDYVYLSDADLRNARLIGATLEYAHLEYAHLEYADLRDVDLRSTHLDYAILCDADLSGVNMPFADLRVVDLRNADLQGTNLSNADLSGADLSGAKLRYTIFGAVDLSTVKGLEMVRHRGPSTIGIDTIYRSHGNIPEVFLKGAGIDDTFITYIRSLVGKPIEYYSCFISYSSKDEAFAKRLYADLQSHNVRCWFAPEDMKTGDEIRHRIDESIRLYDKLLLVLSEHSVASKWVEFEVEAAMDKEQEGKSPVLFLVRLDNTVLESTTSWAKHIKRTRNIGDFTNWKNHDDYEKAFTRLLRDLKSET